MKTIIEYLINNHIQNQYQIISYKDLNHGDHVAFEFMMNNKLQKGFGIFDRVGKYKQTSKDDVVIFYFSACGGDKDAKSIRFNTYNSLTNNYPITYRTVTVQEENWIKDIETYIHNKGWDDHMGNTEKSYPTIGFVENNKLVWE